MIRPMKPLTCLCRKQMVKSLFRAGLYEVYECPECLRLLVVSKHTPHQCWYIPEHLIEPVTSVCKDSLETKESAMKCPLFTYNKMSKEGEWEEFPKDCLQEECAWWDYNRGNCLIGSLIFYLAEILLTLRLMQEKMPPKEEYEHRDTEAGP